MGLPDEAGLSRHAARGAGNRRRSGAVGCPGLSEGRALSLHKTNPKGHLGVKGCGVGPAVRRGAVFHEGYERFVGDGANTRKLPRKRGNGIPATVARGTRGSRAVPPKLNRRWYKLT